MLNGVPQTGGLSGVKDPFDEVVGADVRGARPWWVAVTWEVLDRAYHGAEKACLPGVWWPPRAPLLGQMLDRIAGPDPGVALRSGLMAVEWTGSDPELLLDQVCIDSVSHVDREVGGTARDRILPVGQLGPTSRALAEHFGVSCGLVSSSCPQVQSEDP
jgi:hypothetical protein